MSHSVTRLLRRPEHVLVDPVDHYTHNGSTWAPCESFPGRTAGMWPFNRFIVGGPTVGDRVLHMPGTVRTGKFIWGTIQKFTSINADNVGYNAVEVSNLFDWGGRDVWSQEHIAGCGCDFVHYLQSHPVEPEQREWLLSALRIGVWLNP